MKCPRCNQDKSEESFLWKIPNKKRQPYCRECNRLYQREHYQRNKTTYKAKAKRYKKTLTDRVNELKKKPCTDCKSQFNPWQMDFDHKENKEFNISDGLRTKGYSWIKLEKELSKCDLVCSNCHRNRTHNRMTLSSTFG